MLDLLFQFLVYGLVCGGVYAAYRLGIEHERFERMQRRRMQEILEAAEEEERLRQIAAREDIEIVEDPAPEMPTLLPIVWVSPCFVRREIILN